MIYDITDGLFRIFMWLLIDPSGKNVFFAVDTLGFFGCLTYLIWDFRRDNDVEKTRRFSNTRSQRESTESEDKGST